jgi:hypothetical protein
MTEWRAIAACCGRRCCCGTATQKLRIGLLAKVGRFGTGRQKTAIARGRRNGGVSSSPARVPNRPIRKLLQRRTLGGGWG